MPLESVYEYKIPLEEDAEGVNHPAYEPDVKGKQYLYHYGEHYLYIIQERPARKFHRDSVAVDVTIHSKEAVEEADANGNLIERFVRDSLESEYRHT